jgi:hypothetical protein
VFLIAGFERPIKAFLRKAAGAIAAAMLTMRRR